MIDELGFAGSNRNFCKLTVIAKHIDQRRFSHVTSADKRNLRPVRRRTFVERRTADEITRIFDLHDVQDKVQGTRHKAQEITELKIVKRDFFNLALLCLAPCALCL